MMADESTKRGGLDVARIGLSEDDEVRYWSKEFGVSELELQAAVEKVGPMAEDVRRFLNK